MGLTGFALSMATGGELHVSPEGNDTNPGTKAAPLQSLAAARDAARVSAGAEPVTVHVADGVYYLPETLVFTPADSGSTARRITYRAVNEGGAVLSGGAKLNLQWQPYRDGIFQAATPPGLAIDQLFINGKSQRMARYPNYDATKPTAAYQGFAADAFSKERAAGWADPTGGYIHAMHRSRWGGYHYRITGKKPDGEVTYEGGWQNNRQMGMHEEFRMVENIFEELDAPGEWFHEARTRTLYYMPEPGTDLPEATVEVVRLRHLVEFRGSREAPVKHVTLQGFVVRHAARTFMDCREPLLRSDWAIYRGGAITLTGTEDIGILDTEFDQVGGNAIFVSNYNRRTVIRGCHIHDAGASGVCFVGDPAAVRNPLFEYGQKNDLSTIDRTPGPKTDAYPADCTVEDCLIHGIGRVERQPAGVQIAMAMAITVRDASIHDCARAGINIGDGCWGGHLIERCDVFDTVLETHDHGSFNSWGRDRYWRHDHLEASQKAVDAEPGLPFLDAMNTTVIRDSRWRCDHGWDIDLDDGSSNYDITNNLMLGGGLKLREGFRRRAWNNITVNNGFHPHVWFNNSQDDVFGNIFMCAHRGARMPSDIAKGKRVDGNLFFSASPGDKDRHVRFGWDVYSIAADPLFVDPTKGDFRVKRGSPASRIGFRNFPMDQFGVKKTGLKAIARTPVIPALGPPREERHRGPAKTAAAQAMDSYWLGAKLHGLEGAEFSAYGVSRKAGGVALVTVPAACEAARAGLQPNDLIQAVNTRKVSSTAQLFSALHGIGSAPFKLSVIRDQKSMEIAIPQHSYVEFETVPAADGFARLPPPTVAGGTLPVNQKTNSDPVHTLVDGKLRKGYGPVFGNGISNGAYKMDLGKPQSVAAITSWSYNQGGGRGAQRLTLYGSNSPTDPGWDLATFTPLGTIDTTGVARAAFTAAALRAPAGQSLGEFRWIVWRVSPVTPRGGGENTAFQELAVETVGQAPEGAVQAPTGGHGVSTRQLKTIGTPTGLATDADGAVGRSGTRPNVVLIMTDDQGYGDLGCLGNPILKTPNLDRLHSESVRFTDFHVSSFCTPTRAALMTGRYPGRTGAYRTSSGRTMMHTDEKTVADVFSSAGYATGMVGKWHLGDSAPHRPQDRGFQDVAWHRCGGVGQGSDYWGNDYFGDTYERNGTFERFDGYCTDVWFAESIRFIEENKDRPFFLYLATNAPHGPYRVGPEWSKPYFGKATWNQGANFYGMIANIDHNLGLLRERLDTLGLAENTILIFMTDNGTANGAAFGPDKLNSEAVEGFNAGMRGKKSSVYEGGHRVPFFIHWPAGGLVDGRNVSSLAAHIDVLPTLADLCGIPVPESHQPDGVSFAGLLRDRDAPAHREHLIVQVQGGPHFRAAPKAWEYTCVLKDRWRLIDGRELFDLSNDPAQRNDISAQHPDVVRELWGLYPPFWESVSPRMSPVSIDLGNPADNPTTLCSQDWYMPTGNPPWSFGQIRKLPRVTGPWMVHVRKAGRYRLTLRQLPPQADAAVKAVRARIQIAGQEMETAVEPGSKGVVFEMDLPAGKTELRTFLYNGGGEAGGAYFAEVEAL